MLNPSTTSVKDPEDSVSFSLIYVSIISLPTFTSHICTSHRVRASIYQPFFPPSLFCAGEIKFCIIRLRELTIPYFFFDRYPHLTVTGCWYMFQVESLYLAFEIIRGRWTSGQGKSLTSWNTVHPFAWSLNTRDQNMVLQSLLGWMLSFVSAKDYAHLQRSEGHPV